MEDLMKIEVCVFVHCLSIIKSAFYRAACNADAVYSDENLSVRLSVCPSVCQTCGLWQNGDRSRFLYHTKDHL